MEPIEDLLRRISERTQRKKTASEPDNSPRRRTRTEQIASLEIASAAIADEANTLDPTRAVLEYDAHICILVALPQPELDQVLRAFPCVWSKEGREGVVFNVGRIRAHDLELTVAVATQNSMGMVPAAILATKTIRAWRPKLLAMAGICAGIKGKVNLGDVILARHIFDYGSGKLVKGRLVPDYEPVHMDEALCSLGTDLANDREFIRSIRDGWTNTTGKPDTELKVVVGAFASGAAVVADESLIDGIREHKRSLVGIDMEAYGVARSAVSSYPPTPFLIAKGVQDFANDTKDDQYREYAAYTSAHFILRLVTNHFLQRFIRP